MMYSMSTMGDLMKWLEGAQDAAMKHALLISDDDIEIAIAVLRGALTKLDKPFPRNQGEATQGKSE